ncbi:MAG: glycerophosphodiester phosphodiesterase [Clostridia bacterium]|nr:glycerophosphodiester phosphodiesterase [Clostridia bacterium]
MYEWKDEYFKQIALSGDRADGVFRNSERCLIEGHRGAKALMPENTLESFAYALELGVDALETDVNMTKDGVPVLCHDRTVDRTTDGSGVIRQFTLEELKGFDAGARFGDGEFAGKGYRIPTLEEFCEFMDAHREILLNVEIKDYGIDNIDRTLATLGAHGLLGNCIFACFDASVIHYLFERYGVKTQGFLGKQMKRFRRGKNGTYSELYAIGVEMKYFSCECVEFLNDLDIQPWCWCCDDEETVKYAIASGTTLMTCNDPRPALKVIRGV